MRTGISEYHECNEKNWWRVLEIQTLHISNAFFLLLSLYMAHLTICFSKFQLYTSDSFHPSSILCASRRFCASLRADVPWFKLELP